MTNPSTNANATVVDPSRAMRQIVAGAMSATVALGIIANAVAAPADASPSQDALFLSLITSSGMGYTSADSAIWQGHKICTLLDDGWPVSAVEAAAESAFTANYDQSMTVMASAVIAYCPWQEPHSPSANV